MDAEYQGPEIDKEVDPSYNIDRNLSFSCLKCDKKFSNDRNLAAHDFMKHQSGMDSNEKSLSYCKTPLKLDRHLKQHRRIYTGDKSFS